MGEWAGEISRAYLLKMTILVMMDQEKKNVPTHIHTWTNGRWFKHTRHATQWSANENKIKPIPQRNKNTPPPPPNPQHKKEKWQNNCASVKHVKHTYSNK